MWRFVFFSSADKLSHTRSPSSAPRWARPASSRDASDPLVQKRNADAQANAEYRASKKASKAELKAADKEAKAQYKQEVRNAKINKKADKQAAKDDLNAAADRTPKDQGEQH